MNSVVTWAIKQNVIFFPEIQRQEKKIIYPAFHAIS